MISPLNGCWIPMFHTPWLHMILWHPNHSIDASWWTKNCKNQSPADRQQRVANKTCLSVDQDSLYSLSIYLSIHVNLIINLCLYLYIHIYIYTTTLLCLTKENHQPTPPVFDADEHGNADACGEDRKRHDFHAGGPFWRHTNLERWISFGKTWENHGFW